MGKIKNIAKYIAGMCRVVFATREGLENNLYTGCFRGNNPHKRDYRKADSYGKTIARLFEVIPNHVYFRKIGQERKIKIKSDPSYIKNFYPMCHLK